MWLDGSYGGKSHENRAHVNHRFPNHHNIIHNGDLFIQLHKEEKVMDRLKELQKPLNVEKEVKTLKKIILNPSSVYGHGLISYKDFEKMIQRIELLEQKVKELRIHTNTNDNMDLLKW